MELPDITIHVPTTTGFSVLFPGYIENIDRARSMLPTEDKLASTQQTNTPLVMLNWRPEDVLSHPLTATRHSRQNLLILKIQQRPTNGGRQHMEVDGAAPGVSVEAVAHCTTCYSFDGMADFQYLPADTRPEQVCNLRRACLVCLEGTVCPHTGVAEPVPSHGGGARSTGRD